MAALLVFTFGSLKTAFERKKKKLSDGRDLFWL